MTLAIVFWVLYIVALLFTGYIGRAEPGKAWPGLVPFVLIGLLGWKVFGPPVSG